MKNVDLGAYHLESISALFFEHPVLRYINLVATHGYATKKLKSIFIYPLEYKSCPQYAFYEKVLSEVGFEPTPTEVDCDLNAAP